MADVFNYNILLKQALQKVRNIRDPRSTRQEYIYYGKSDVQNDCMVAIGGSSYRTYSEMVDAAHKITFECVKVTLFYLFRHYNFEFEIVEESSLPTDIQFALVDRQKSLLLVFKEPLGDFVIATSDTISTKISDYKKQFNVKECDLVYLMYEKADKQFLNPNPLKQTQDKTALSLRGMFDKFFTEEEYTTFRRCFSNYIKVVNEYLGFSVVKNLTPIARVNFAKIVQHRLTNFDYSELLKIKMHEKCLIEDSYRNIQKHYIGGNLYLIMLGNHDFAESLITAEWMYDSMKEAKAVDLTVIGMGYLKAIEQLLYSIILLHRNEGRDIKSNHKNGPYYVTLDDAHIATDVIDSTIGSLANFCVYKKNQDIFRSTLPFKAKKYVTESIFVFKDIRNGYFHKHNIREWSKIDEIRNMTYYLAFLLLGSAELTEANKNELGLPQGDFISDRYKLCEYVNYHAGDHFILCYGENQEAIVVACRDEKAQPVNSWFMCYSGAYFSQFGGPARNVFSDMPSEIYLARIDVSVDNSIQLAPHKVQKVYTSGKFVGPSIIEEIGTQY